MEKEIIELPFGAKDSELQEVTYYIPEGFHAEIDGDKITVKRNRDVTVTAIVETGDGGINALVTTTLTPKRKEEIEKEAQKYAHDVVYIDGEIRDYGFVPDEYDAFMDGAEWADTHPINHDVEQYKKEMLEKAVIGEYDCDDDSSWISFDGWKLNHSFVGKKVKVIIVDESMEDRE